MVLAFGIVGGLPSGLVTFVFTDVEGSTRLFQRLGDRFIAMLEEHRVVVRAAVAARGGVVLNTEGDGFFIAFGDAAAAVEACLDAQLALSTHPWPEEGELRVRMGLHTGVAEPTADGDYLAVAVHLAARIASTAHGGQVILSSETARRVRRRLPGDAALGDRGAFRLKDFDEPERLFQLVHPGLRGAFPPLRASPVQSRGLPDARTSFVGRRAELKSLLDLVGRVALVSVVGPGGAGKTRLALETGARLATRFEAGAQLCDLSPIVDPQLVPAAIASALGVDHAAGEDPLEAVVRALTGLGALLILDNCEQVLDAVASAVDVLLVGVHGLRVLATSREPLGVAGEQVWRIAPLELPPADAGPEQIRDSESGRLFEERARSAQTGFAITADNAPAVREICNRLEGLPLALELAAASVGTMSISTLAARLADRLPALGTGHRRSLSRHRTLEATIDWSYQLLSPEQRQLLMSLSVLAGGFSLDAAEALGRSAGRLEVLVSLVQKSLVVWDSDANRYRMLDSIRQFASDRLSEDDARMNSAWAAHADFFAQRAQEAGAELTGPRQARWLEVLDADHDNLRRALTYVSVDRRDVEGALRMLTALHRYWMIRADHGEWIAIALPLLERSHTTVSDAVRGRALVAATMLFTYENTAEATRFGEEAVEIGHRIRDNAVVAEAMALLAALSLFRGEPDPALAERAVALSRQVGDPVIVGLALLGHGLTQSGHQPSLQRQIYEDAVIVASQSGDDFVRYLVTGNLGIVHLELGDLDAAHSCCEDAVELGETLGYADSIVRENLGQVLLRKGDLEGAADVLAASLRGGGLSRYQSATAVLGIARYAIAMGEWHYAAVLHGFADHALRATGMVAVASEAELLRAEQGLLRDRVAERFDSTYQAGALMSWEEARRLALEVTAGRLSDPAAAIRGRGSSVEPPRS